MSGNSKKSPAKDEKTQNNSDHGVRKSLIWNAFEWVKWWNGQEWWAFWYRSLTHRTVGNMFGLCSHFFFFCFYEIDKFVRAQINERTNERRDGWMNENTFDWEGDETNHEPNQTYLAPIKLSTAISIHLKLPLHANKNATAKTNSIQLKNWIAMEKKCVRSCNSRSSPIPIPWVEIENSCHSKWSIVTVCNAGPLTPKQN